MMFSRPKRAWDKVFLVSLGFAIGLAIIFRSPPSLLLTPTTTSLPFTDIDRTISTYSHSDDFSNVATQQLSSFTGDEYQHQQIRNTSCYSSSNDSFCLPSLIIPGFEKSGSSALYFKLLQHPSILGHPKVKEWCPTRYDSTNAVVEWAKSEFLPELSYNSSQNFLLNGCLQYVANPRFFRTVANNSKSLKVLVMIRNFADWAYSYYSYRCIEGYDFGCASLRSEAALGPWKKNRNSTDFHDLVLDSSNGESPRHAYFDRIRPGIWLYRKFLNEIEDTVGIENLLILRQEDLTLSPHETLHRAARFIGVDENAFHENAYSLVSNTNSEPARKHNLPNNSSAEEASEVINSGRAIMTKTRVLLNEFWSQECDWLRSTYNIAYPDVC